MKHIIFHAKDGTKARMGEGFIIPALAALAGLVMPKLFGGGVTDEHGNILVHKIPRHTKKKLAEKMRDCLEMIEIETELMDGYVNEVEESSSDEEGEGVFASGKSKKKVRKGGYSSGTGKKKPCGKGIFSSGIYGSALDDAISGTGKRKKKTGSGTVRPTRKVVRSPFLH